MAKFTHVLETLLNEMRDGRRAVTPEGVNLLLESVDCLREMLTAVRAKDPVNQARVADMQARLEAMLGSSATPAATETATPVASAVGAGWTIRFRPKAHLFTTGNDPLRIVRELSTLGELSVVADIASLPEFADMNPESSYLGWTLTLHGDVPLAAVNEIFDWVRDDSDLEIAPLADVRSDAPERRENSDRRTSEDRRVPTAAGEGTSIRVDISKVDALINMVGELVITQNILKQLGENFDINNLHKLKQGLSDLERNTREMQETVMRIRMLPISFAFNRVPRLVHDLSTQLGKKVELKMAGETPSSTRPCWNASSIR